MVNGRSEDSGFQEARHLEADLVFPPFHLDSSDQREVEYRVTGGELDIEVYARGYDPEDAALAIRLVLEDGDDE